MIQPSYSTIEFIDTNQSGLSPLLLSRHPFLRVIYSDKETDHAVFSIKQV